MKFRITLVLLALVMPTVTNALGLGKLELQSGLNQPFKARVKLLSATADELDSLKVSLADQEAFDRAGIQRTFLLSRLRFAIQESESGPDYIQIRSNDLIREPFLNFLLEINWAKGRLYREYTVLLDPPTYNASGNKRQAVVHPQAPVVEKDTADNQVVYDLEYKADKPRVTAPARSTPSYETPRAVNYSGSGDYGPAVTGDTLWSIAKAARPDSSVSIQQMMLAILSANSEAFIENNINGLKRGAILQIPDASEVSSLAQADALAQVSNQHALWDEFKGHIASSVPARAQGAGVSSSETESVDIERESSVTELEETDEAKLRLISESDQGSGSDQSSAESSGVDIDSLNNDLVLANESIEALSMENAELKDKLTETEGIIDDLKRLIVLKEDELAAMQEQIMVAAVEQDSTDEIATETDTEEAMEEATDESTDETMEEDTVEEEFTEESEEAEEEEIFEDVESIDGEGMDTSSGLMGYVDKAKTGLMGLVDIATNNLKIVGGVIGGLILLVLMRLFVSKRRSAKATVIDLPAEDFPDFGDEDSAKTVLTSDELAEGDSESVTVLPGSEDETILPGDGSDAVGDVDAFDIPDIPEESSPATAAEPEEDDPMEEVNVFLAYEHFDEAESFVRGALEKEPDNLDFHGKLLEVFYAAGNKKSYEEAARAVHEKTGGQGAHWDMATVMWQEMSPNRALFDAPQAGEDEETSADTPSEGVLNIAAGDDESATNDMDFDIGGEESGEDILDVTAAADMDSISAQTDDDNDLDISLDTEEATASADALDISFDEPSSEDDVLDVTMAAESDDANELDISLDSEEATGSADALDISFDEPSSEDDVLDVTMAAESDDANELDFSLDSEEATASADALDLSFDEPSSEDDVLDVSMAEESDDANELDFSLDSEEATASADALDLSFDEPSSEDDVLDVSMAEESDNANELDISLDSEEATGSADALDLSFDEPSSEDDVLDVSMAEESDNANELDFSLDTEEATGSADALDLSFDEPSSEDDVLDLSVAAESDDSSLLDQPLESKATDSPSDEEDLLDVTSAFNYESEGVEDLLDVTAAISPEDIDAGGLILEPDAAQEEPDGMDLDLSMSEDSSDIGLVDDLSDSVENKTDGLMDDVSMDLDDSTGDDSDGLDFDLGLDDSESAVPADDLLMDDDDFTGGESDGLDFDLGIDDDTNESAGLELDDSKGDNDFDLDISDIGMESDADSLDMDMDMDMESTVQMPAASVDSLIMAEDDDDKTFLVPKTSDVDEQSGDEEMASQLDLAKAYIELGDTDNAKTILDEIIAQGSDDYRKQAEELIGQID